MFFKGYCWKCLASIESEGTQDSSLVDRMNRCTGGLNFSEIMRIALSDNVYQHIQVTPC